MKIKYFDKQENIKGEFTDVDLFASQKTEG